MTNAIEDILDTARPGWRERRNRRKSAWNLVCVALGFGMGLVYWYGFLNLIWSFHCLVYPTHTVLKDVFFHWLFVREKATGPGGGTFPEFLMGVPTFFPALVLGLLTSNFVIWSISPARMAMNREAGGDRELTFRGANSGLIKFGAPVAFIGLALALVGALTLRSL